MLTERLTFRTRYGRGDELAALFREQIREQAPAVTDPEVRGVRLLTDATGAMFTVIVETDFDDLAAYAAYQARMRAEFATPEFAQWFERMVGVTEAGERQLFASERLL